MVALEVNNAVGDIVCASIAAAAVALRLVARKRAKLRYGWDDYFSVLASLTLFSVMGICIWGYNEGGWGNDPMTLPLPKLQTYLKAIYIGPVLVVTAIFFAKMSIMCLLFRIFGVNRPFRIGIYSVVAYIIVLAIVTILVLLLQCNPVRAAWDPIARLEGASCLDANKAAVGSSVVDASSELMMCILPINLVRKLKLPLRQRIALCIIFALGFITAVLAIVRATESSWPGSKNADLTNQVLLIDIQVCVGIVAGCMPTYRKLLPENLGVISTYFRRARSGFSSPGRSSRRGQTTDQPKSLRTDSEATSKHAVSHQASFEREDLNPYLYELDPRRGEVISDIRASDSPEAGSQAENRTGSEPPSNRIQVAQSFSVV